MITRAQPIARPAFGPALLLALMLALMPALAALSGCQEGPPPAAAVVSSTPAADPREAQVLAVGEYLELPRFAAADLARGERLFLQCTVCHTLGRQQAHSPNGPNLWGMFGRRAAYAADFPYSAALRDFEGVWTPATLEQWLRRPASYIPGNIMPFAGIRDREELTDLIAYLLQQTSYPD